MKTLEETDNESIDSEPIDSEPIDTDDAEGDAIAVVGMAGRFPGAGSVEGLWTNLCQGVESISFYTDEELRAEGVDAATLASPNYVKAWGSCEGFKRFDAEFFGFTPREAEIMDPQHRMFLECAVEALEFAGCDPWRYEGLIGLYAGSGLSSYGWLHIASDPELLASVGGFQAILGNDRSHLANQVSYRLNLRGPSIAVQTACSTSLVAVHLACLSLSCYECDLALAGGVSIRTEKHGYWYQEGGINSPDGHCRAFDAEAGGTVGGSGAGVVALKRLADALAEGDTILAVIRGSAVNNDGAQKAGYTAPGVDGQAEVVAAALAAADVEPETITYVETHGTGTLVGDPIEIAALSRGLNTKAKQFCGIGSVKTNLGHLDAAAGVTGLIKVVLALRHGVIPPSLNFRQPNPKIDFESSPFYVNTELTEWRGNGAPRRAGVSSFGIGGTNAHVILEEAPTAVPSGRSRSRQLLLLSARTAPALATATERLEGHLRSRADLDLADLAYTLKVGRRAFEHRRVLVCEGLEDALDGFGGEDSSRLATSGPVPMGAERPVGFLFPGQGVQHVGMGRRLYETEVTFREHVDQASELLAADLEVDLRELLWPTTGRPEASRRLMETRMAQPALFVVEYALAQVWMEWGIRPAAMLGHSLGEIVAACVAGVLSYEDALRLVAARGRLMQSLSAGSMLAVSLSEEELRPRLVGGLSLAAVNAADRCVVSGLPRQVEELARELSHAGVACQALRSSRAFHSAEMDLIIDPFIAFVRRLELRPPKIRYLSNVTGTWITEAEATDARYWGKHLRQPVRFSQGLDELLTEPDVVLLEVGPGRTLSGLARRRKVAKQRVVVSSMPQSPPPPDDLYSVLSALGRLWLAGVEPDWRGFYLRQRRRRVDAPTYPFERARYWIEAGGQPAPARSPMANKKLDLDQWFYVPYWRSLAPRFPDRPETLAEDPGWLILIDEMGVGERLVQHFERLGHQPVAVQAGSGFARLSDRRYVFDPRQAGDYQHLLQALTSEGGIPRHIVHLLSVTSPSESPSGADAKERFERCQDVGFYSLLFLAQALAAHPPKHAPRLTLISTSMQSVFGEVSEPEKATLLAPHWAIPREYSGVTCRSIDLHLAERGRREDDRSIEVLATELIAPGPDPIVAWRRDRMWAQDFERIRLPTSGEAMASLRHRGVYLIVGGLGQLGLQLAESLAELAQARLVLVGRSSFPPREEWASWVRAHGRQDSVSRKICRLEACLEAGAQVLVMQADVAEEAQMRGVVRRISECFGPLNGVFHTAVADVWAFAPIAELGVEACEAQFRAKVDGVLALENAMRSSAVEGALDFCVLFSSMASLLGGPGLFAYTAANQFLDAFARQSRVRQGGLPWMSVNWDRWQRPESGVAASKELAAAAATAITPEEGREALWQVLSLTRESQVLVSTCDLQARLEQHPPVAPSAAGARQRGATQQTLHPRPEMEPAYVAPSSEVERTLTGIWQELLGIERIGVDDDLYELGGDSLLATRIVSRVHQVFGVALRLPEVFESPTVAGLAGRIEAAVQEGVAVAAQEIVPVRRGAPLLPSFAQERLWFIDQLAPGSAAYNLPVALQIGGRLDPGVLARTLTEVYRRHEALRTTFTQVDGQPFQVIAPSAPAPLPEVDLAALSPEHREAEMRRLVPRQSRRPFDLSRGPLIRAILLRLAAEEHVAILVMHHIISDAWSIEVLTGEIAQLYSAFSSNRPSPLEDLPLQYADFAVWQRGWLDGEVLASELGFWKEMLGDSPPLELPLDRPRPPVPTFSGERHEFRLTGCLTAARALSREQRTTLFMTLLTVFQTQLYRYSGQEDINVGTPIAGRNRLEIEGLIGFFVNMLVLRTELTGAPSFTEALGRVREVAFGAFAHQEVPFEKLVMELVPERDPSHQPLFQAVFALNPERGGGLELPGLSITPLRFDVTKTQFDLMLTVVESGNDLHASLDYRVDLFDKTTAIRLGHHFEILVRALLVDSGCRLSELPLLSPPEREQVVLEWNDTASNYPSELSIGEIFVRQVERTPDATAVEFGDRRLTYRQLAQRSDRVAGGLRTLGVDPEVPVGLCLEPGLEMVVGLLGILEAGGAYVPLDPSYPEERLGFMIEDAGLRVLLTQESMLEQLPESVRSGPLMRVALDTERWEQEGTRVLAPRPNLENLAYVAYTSGSTGRPKGIGVPHRAVLRLVLETDYAQLGPGDRVAHASNISFDAATFEVWGALLTGATLVGVPRDVTLSPRAFASALVEHEINTLFLTTALFNQMARAAPEGFSGLKHLLFGGEAVDLRWVREVLERGAPERLLHVYGPTESTTYATWHKVDSVLVGARTVPIGLPLANTRAYVLDRWLHPVPVGVLGELCLGGDGLARGYSGRAGLTSSFFVPDPVSGEGGSRLYRTGDLVRRLSGGEVEFVGRFDHQVKLRGFRIELGEIEAILGQHPEVEEVIVVLGGASTERGNGVSRLVAYLVMSPEAILHEETLRVFLGESLPDYMVPSVFVKLDSLPMTPNGKVDRAALPAPERERPELGEAYVSPGTPIEELLSEIWSRVLEVERVGVNDSFFELGGHSLLATQLVSRVRQAFQVELELQTVFDFPTIAGQALAVARAREEGPAIEIPPLESMDRDRELPLSFAQQRLWFLDQLAPGNSIYNIPLAMRVEGRPDVEILQRCLTEIVKRHEGLRTTFGMANGRPVQVIAPPAPVPLPVVDLSALRSSQRLPLARRLARAEARRPFDFVRGPLLRVGLLRLDEGTHVLLLAKHHVISDGWSMGVMFDELTTLYQALAEGKASPLPRLPIQYADFAIWQREWLRGDVLEQQIAYWKDQLAGAPPVLDLPTDRPRAAVQSLRGAHRDFLVPRDLVTALGEFSRRQGVTMFMTLLACGQALLSRYNGQRDISVGTPIAGRTHVETEGLIGFFVNTLVLRTDLSGRPGLRQLVRRTREVNLQAHSHQYLPFEKLVEELQPERNLSHTPLFQVMFILQNLPESHVELPGLTLRPLDGVDTGGSQFDLIISLNEGSDGLTGALKYSPDLFDASTMARMEQHFLTLLRALVEEPERPFTEHRWLGRSERHQLTTEWNDTAESFPVGGCFHELFAEQVSRRPQSAALITGEEQISYRELDRHANRLAHYLRGLGVGPESRVAICLERSPEMIVALLAVLKAGAAYVPLDPSYPSRRLRFMLEDSGACLVLTHSDLEEVAEASEVRAVRVDVEAAAIAQHREEPPSIVVSGENLAYVIYTSGSTGTPKGVMVAHAKLMNLIRMFADVFGVRADSRVLQFASLSFDASIWEVSVALTTGAALCLVARDEILPGAGFAELLRERGISAAVLPPSTLAAMLDEELPRLETLVTAGEACPVDVAVQWSRGRRFLNAYGPTETTIGATIQSSFAPGVKPDIGHPLPNFQVHLRDAEGQRLPIGIPGELQVGGAGIARGYLGRPGLTAERFVPDPFSGVGGGRLYRTGDLTRRLTDGRIDFLGRIDFQVKVRGFRIEPGEIVQVLGQHPRVREAAVVPHGEATGNPQLVAYYVLADGAVTSEAHLSEATVPRSRTGRAAAEEPRVSPDDLRQFLKNEVPEHMVPAFFIELDEMPLTPSKKVDRDALPTPGRTRLFAKAEVAPRDAVESDLAEIWKEIMDLDSVGVEDNFFELGGHSLMAVRLVSAIEQQLGIKLSVATLFHAPTIEELAAWVRGGGDAARKSLVPIRARGNGPALYWTHPASGNVFGYQNLAVELNNHHGYRSYGFQALGLDGEEAPFGKVEHMAAHYIEELVAADPQGPYYLGGWSVGGVVAFEMARQLEERGRHVVFLALLDTRVPSPHDRAVANDETTQLRVFAHDFGISLDTIGVTLGDLLALSDDERLEFIFRRSAEVGMLPSEIDLPQIRRLFTVFKASAQALARYQPGRYRGKMTFFRSGEPIPQELEPDAGWMERVASKGRALSETVSTKVWQKYKTPALGWEDLTEQKIDVIEARGHHFEMLRPPHVVNLAKRLVERLRRAEEVASKQ